MCLRHDSSLSSTFQVGLSHLVHLEDTFPQVVERVQSALVARGAMPHGICQRTKFDLLYLLQMDIEKTLKTPECWICTGGSTMTHLIQNATILYML